MPEPREVIETLVNELDKHGHGDMHWFVPNYRDPNVVAALAVGRAWLEAHAVTARAQEVEELCSYYGVPDSKEDDVDSIKSGHQPIYDEDGSLLSVYRPASFPTPPLEVDDIEEVGG
jgi:hypothetical protein